MPRGKELTPVERGAIKAYKDTGKSNREIARLLKRSEKAVRNCLLQKDGVPRKKRPGRPRKLTERDARHIFRLATVKDMSATEIAKTLAVKPSKDTVLRALRNNRYAKYSKRKSAPDLKPHHKAARLAFATKYKAEKKFWLSVLFTDEKKFNLDGPDGFRFYWRDLRAQPKLMSKRVNGGGSVMIWAGVSWHGKTSLVILKGKQNAVKYTETLRENALSCLSEMQENMGGAKPILQQDNASIHAAKLTRAFLEENGVTTLEWPAKSPDFNIIENVWGLLARRVYANGRQFDRPTDLERQISIEWSKIDQEYIQKLVKSMPRRMEAARLLKGATTAY